MAGTRHSHDFTGKVVLVTGGSRGLGHAMSLAFAECGASVAVASRKIEACESTVREIEALGSKGSAHAAHVGSWADCTRLADEVYARWGRIDVLVNNAGMSPIAPSLRETSEELFDKVIGVNLKGPFRLCALIGARMAEGNGGSIVNFSSIAALHPRSVTAIYSAAKAGIHAITGAFAQEYGPKVRVNTIVPGPFQTDASKGWATSESFTRRARETFPMGRIGQPEEIVGAALYFASPASSYTTGAMLVVDGGEMVGRTDQYGSDS